MHRATLGRVAASFGLGLLAGCAIEGGSVTKQPSAPPPAIFSPDATAAVVRYQVQDVDRAVDFYTRHLGFLRTQRSGPVAVVSRGDLHLLFSGPASSGSRPMPDGRRQESGGWNRIVLYVERLDAAVAALTGVGAHFRNKVEVGPGGKQILVDDPDGNPVELHEGPQK
jgi:catechol 2,3-dioxygenase-like lactoylglutathione lyase family enzyme